MESNFAWFDKPISEIPDNYLIDFYISLLNSSPFNEEEAREYEIFREEVPKRSKEFQAKIAKIDSIL